MGTQHLWGSSSAPFAADGGIHPGPPSRAGGAEANISHQNVRVLSAALGGMCHKWAY